ncbi:IPExxxVDY family protein [Robertkochia sediminum]|uniref:IPExxxVDY family protein n=1 Tax=Robertkochia sediminum TaxID=2785326 RepID=UPI0019342F13|nr:IPExxxVDY family protein [Robertkochia sediminum]MBL7473821.1 IPExxxVDY family protein [Robertkochia sediminum]
MTTVHKLDDDFYVDTYTLIAIHSSLDSYRLAYFLNRSLDVQLKRLQYDLKLGEGSEFSLYEAYDRSTEVLWNLLTNKCGVTVVHEGGIPDMFGTPGSITYSYVLPEFPKVDHLLKIDDGEGSFSKAQEVIRIIKQIPQVITAYELDIDQLKSKNNLIFLTNA